MNSDFIFEATLPDCSLPCWQGLRIGKSGFEEIEDMFRRVFQLDQTYNIFAAAERVNIPGQTQPIKRYFIGSSTLTIGLWTEDKTDKLKAITLYLSSQQASQHITAQRVIEERGQPFEMKVAMELVQSPGPNRVAFLYLFMIYQDGLEFKFHYRVTPYFRTSNDQTTMRTYYCLSDVGEEGGADLSIMEPLLDGLDSLDPIQDLLIPERIGEGFDYYPFQDAFGVSLSDLTQRVQSGEQVCLDGGVP